MRRIIPAATTCVTAVLVALTPAIAAAAPPLEPRPAITPGSGMADSGPDGTGGDACTIGFLAHTKTGQAAMLTAGHCDKGGPAFIKYTGTGKYEPIGSFQKTVSEGEGEADSDIAMVGLNSSVPKDLRVIGIRPITGSTSNLRIGQDLCHFGLASGLQCGAVRAMTPTKVVYGAKSAPGDSGGPVYVRNPDGTATAVGVLLGGKPDGGTVAELAEPWLRRWELTLDTTNTGPGVQNANYHR